MNESACPIQIKIQHCQNLLQIYKQFSTWKQFLKIITVIVFFISMTCVWYVCEGIAEKMPSYFLTGNQYLQQKAEIRLTYVMGLCDGIQLSKMFSPKNDRFYDLLERMTAPQIIAIVDKYLKDNPQEWHKPMNYIFFFALNPQKKP